MLEATQKMLSSLDLNYIYIYYYHCETQRVALKTFKLHRVIKELLKHFVLFILF